MKKKSVVYIIWAVWYLCCLFLSLGAEPAGMAKVPFVVMGISTFAPPFYLLYLSKKEKKHIKVVQIISAASLIAFVVLFVLNLASVKWGATAGFVLDLLFKIFCAPIVCGQFWIVGLFLWASLWRSCVLMRKKLDQKPPKSNVITK